MSSEIDHAANVQGGSGMCPQHQGGLVQRHTKLRQIGMSVLPTDVTFGPSETIITVQQVSLLVVLLPAG